MNKHTYLILLLAICIPLLAESQITPNIVVEKIGTGEPYSEQMEECLEPLDKSLVTTNLLIDKAILFTPMDSYNGLTDSIISLTQWKQIFQQLHLASITPNRTLLLDSLNAQADRFLKQRVVPIGVFNIDYNQIKPYALDSNLIVLSNGKMYDAIGRNESPYEKKHVFAAVALDEKSYHGQVTFRIDDAFLFSNISEDVSSIEIDFGDGQGYRRFVPNQFPCNVTVDYRQAGTKNISVRMMFSDQTIMISKSCFEVVTVNNVEPDNVVPINGYVPYLNISGTGTAYIMYGCGNNGKLRKPIIVSDGFDPNNKNDFYALYEMLNEENFIESARAEGYDFVILDYDNGDDYIQRNAFVMVSLINYVNDQLAENGSASQLVIIGPSMGGLISRYALSFMEQNGLNHNTQLYVSFDSPHLGANIPLGDQFWIYFFAVVGEKQDAIEAKAMLDSPAAEQMLVYHYASDNTNRCHFLRNEFLMDPCFGWPVQCRKIAIANGSGEGVTYFNPGTQMIEYNFLLGGLVKGNTWAVPSLYGDRQMIFEGSIVKLDWTFYEGLKVYAQGTWAFDGAPGGGRDVNLELANGDTQGHGDITTNYPDVCFIPLISSMCLHNTTNVNYNVHDIPGYPYPSSNITPFDAIYAPVDNQDHVTVTEENIAWIMNEIGAFDMYLQNQTVNKATDFEARNTITTGRNVVTYIPEGEFVVKNESGEVLLQSEGFIRLKDGTYLRPSRTGTVRLCATQFLCPSWITHTEDSPVRNNDDVEKEIEEPITSEAQEWIPEMQTEKLPRNHPNPCRDFTTVEYELKNTAKVEIDVFNFMGVKLMTEKDNQAMGAGRYSTTIKTSSLPVGVYIGVVRANGEINGVFKMQVVR